VGSVITLQLYFDQCFSDRVGRMPPFTSHGPNTLTNAADGTYNPPRSCRSAHCRPFRPSNSRPESLEFRGYHVAYSVMNDRAHVPDAEPEKHSAPTFEKAYAEVAPALFAWAELRIRPSMRLRLEPADLLQEVWLRGKKAYPRFDTASGSFRAWAFRIGKNVLMEAIRSIRHEALSMPGLSPTNRMLALEGVPQNVTSFTQRLANEDSIREFLKHADGLDESDRMLLIHCGLEDETCAEAAPKLGLSEDAAIKRWQRLKAKLREKPWSRSLLGIQATSSSD